MQGQAVLGLGPAVVPRSYADWGQGVGEGMPEGRRTGLCREGPRVCLAAPQLLHPTYQGGQCLLWLVDDGWVDDGPTDA